ncbi:MAG: GTP 3',8-cyclase MoaA [Deltaproteobacteria bacterium]|nr:GTP 3',8-cyclase MoaA [Deltaproteobacteria bacterium]
MTVLHDSYARNLTYLRISLTDRCNFRCVYCMPPEGIKLLPRAEVLTLEEIERLARIFVSLGVNKIRLTGGEPLLRKRIVYLVSSLSRFDGLRELGLTTNGSFLADLAFPLKEAGLNTVNVSLDSLNRERFARITLRDELPEVLSGVTRALEAGLAVKINAVALSDLTRDEVVHFCRLAQNYPLEVRFLEFMPLCGTGYKPELVAPFKGIKSWVFDEMDLVPLPRDENVAETYQVKDGPGRIGFIASMSEPFCGTCTRLRLTSTGGLRLCLFSPLEIDLRTPLRSGAADDEIADLIRKGVWKKPKGHEEYLGKTQYRELPKIRMLGG